MKALKRLKLFWNILCGLFFCMELYNFMMPNSYDAEQLAYRLFYLALAVLFGAAGITCRAVIRANEERRDNKIE